MNFWTAWLKILCVSGAITTFLALGIILAAWIMDHKDDIDEEEREKIKFDEEDPGIMKLYINFDNETKKVDINVISDEYGNDLKLCDAMPYITAALHDLILEAQKKSMMR